MALGLSVMSNSGEQKRGTEETTSFHDFLKFMPPRDSIDKIVVKDSFAQVKLVSGHSKYFKIPNVEVWLLSSLSPLLSLSFSLLFLLFLFFFLDKLFIYSSIFFLVSQ